MKSIIQTITATIGLSISAMFGCAYAADVASPSNAAPPAAASTAVPTVTSNAGQSDELGERQRQKMLLSEDVEIERLKSTLRKLRAENNSDGLLAPGGGAQPAATALSTAARMPDLEFQFLGSGSYGSASIATLAVHGTARDVRLGDVVDGGWKVSTISSSGVELIRGATRRWIKE